MNNEIKLLNQDGKVVVSSRVVAQDFGKRHADVLEKIAQKLANGKIRSLNYFIENTYCDGQHKPRKEYLMTRDGFTFIVMGFTGEKADEFKLKYIEAFNKMEEMIKNQTIVQLDSYMIENPIERAKRWIEEREERDALENERNQLLIETKELNEEVSLNKDIIVGLTEHVTMADLRQRISRIIRHGGKGRYAERYGLLYKEYEEKFHISLSRRMKRDIEAGVCRKSTTKMDYICDVLGHTVELYELATKVFKADFSDLLSDIQEIINNENYGKE